MVEDEKGACDEVLMTRSELMMSGLDAKLRRVEL